MRKEDKTAIIAQLGELLKQYPHFYLVDVEGMNAASTSSLRRKCFEKDLKMVVVKNTLMIKALEAAEGDFDELKPVMVGTTALILTEMMMVGNSFKSDIAPALAIGCSAVHIPFHLTWELEKAQMFEHPHLYTITRFGELLSLLSKNNDKSERQ